MPTQKKDKDLHFDDFSARCKLSFAAAADVMFPPLPSDFVPAPPSRSDFDFLGESDLLRPLLEVVAEVIEATEATFDMASDMALQSNTGNHLGNHMCVMELKAETFFRCWYAFFCDANWMSMQELKI